MTTDPIDTGPGADPAGAQPSPPPVSPVDRSERAANRGSGGLAFALRLTTDRWAIIDDPLPMRGLATVVGAWLLMAWARLGVQGITAPRSMVRFVLVGVYSWLALAAVVWLGAELARRLDRTGPRPDGHRALQFTGLVHQPVAILGVIVLFGQVLPFSVVFTVAAVAALAVWLPAQLVTSMVAAFGRVDRWSIGTALAAVVVWAVVPARYLVDRVGHLF